MSGDRPISTDSDPAQGTPRHGTAAGVAYLALPPTAVDARPAGPTRLIALWPGFDPPRSAEALAMALPLTGVPTWRVYLELPPGDGPPPEGLGSGSFLESAAVEAYGAAVEGAVERLPDVLADLRAQLDVPDGPVGLAGFSAGGAAALLAVATGTVPVSAAAVVAPIVSPRRAARALENRSARRRAWSEPAEAVADRLDLGSRARDVAARDVPLLIVGGSRDRVVPPAEITNLRDLLLRTGASGVEAATFRMEHALAAEPGVEPRPPITEAVRVDGVLTDWFRERFAEVTAPRPPHATERGAVPQEALAAPGRQPRDSTS
ncbi:prolyl oligopeptidase family serine peptidase [Actinomadura atramentaria]|uniref:prolyl oligopeptidase family serine peptidase n=1 Tax=Actinomadura atramentaria TaxID=1990 RepID=UPI00036CE6F8|nr:prolyl oligopeptidase family serine peptidase [Actinomadura atramentaria]